MAVDTQWSNVTLLLPMEGANNQTIITDLKGYVVTTNGGAKLSTAQAPTGCTTSLVLDGNNDYLSLSGADLALGGGDWAIEFPVWRIGDTTNGTATDALLIDFRTTDPQVAIAIVLHGSTSGTSNKVGVYINGSERILSTNALSAAFKEVTLAKIGGTLRLFFDGAQEGSSYTDGNAYATTTLTIGGRYAAVSGDYRGFNGYIGPIRITKGNGRGYSATFTPPSLPFPRPTISGHVYDASASPAAKTVLVRDRSSQLLVGGAVSDAATGAYSFSPSDFGEYSVERIDEAFDPYWSNALFSSRLNASGFPTLTGQTLTVTGTVAASAALADPFGGSQPSALFNGPGSYLAASGALVLGAVYTVSGWLYVTALGAVHGVFFNGTIGSNANRTQILIGSAGNVQFYSENGSAVITFNVTTAAGVITAGAWHHFAAVRSNAAAYVFIDGSHVGTALESGTESIGQNVFLGYGYQSSAGKGLAGRLFDVRYSNRAEYLAPFAPPTALSLAGATDGGSGENAIIYDRVIPGSP